MCDTIYLNAVSEQDAFNKAFIGIVKQGCPSIDGYEGCAYRGDNDTKCGIGFLIDDEDYEAAMHDIEGNTIASLLDDGWVEADHLGEAFLTNLQKRHDHSIRISKGTDQPYMEVFVEQMTEFARSYKLEVPQLEEVAQWVK